MATYTISNILQGPTALQVPLDNYLGDKRVAVKSITVWVGWYNIKPESWMAMYKRVDFWEDDGDPNTGVGFWEDKFFSIGQGLKRAKDIAALGDGLSLSTLNDDGTFTITPLDSNPIHIDYDSGISTLTVPEDLFFVMTEDIRNGLGIEKSTLPPITGPNPDNITPYKNGTYTAYLNMWPKWINIHLKQLSTSNNILNGTRSTILKKISPPIGVFGESFTINYPSPIYIYKDLKDGFITELEFDVIMPGLVKIDNHGQPISIELEII